MTKLSNLPFSRSILTTASALLATSLVACSSATTPPQTVAAGAACGQLAGDSQTLERFYEQGTIVSAEPIREKQFKARAIQPTRTMGASLYVNAESDMNAPYLRRVLACHAVAGNSAHPNDPLHPQAGQVTGLTVTAAKNGFAVNVRSDDPKVGQEIWRRAESLSQGGSTVEVEQVSHASQKSSLAL